MTPGGRLDTVMGALASRLATDPRSDPAYKWPLASPAEFFASPYYCGSIAANLWPRIRADLIESLEPKYNEIIIGGSTSSGKSFRAAAVCLYKCYELLSLLEMQASFGLDENAPVYICMASTSKTKSRRTIYSYFRSFVLSSPWFMEHAPPQKDIETQVAWPDYRLFAEPIVSADDGPLGYNLIGLVIDEINELDVVKNSVRAHGIGKIYDQAEEIYEAGRNRQYNRFYAEGKRYWPFIVLAGSSEREQDFQNRRRAEVERLREEYARTGDERLNPRAHISWLALWEAKPPGTFSKETFEIEVGGDRFLSRILKPGDEPRKGARAVQVPVSFYQEAKRNVERFLRRTAGVAISGVSPLIVNRPALYECIRRPAHGHEERCECPTCLAARHPYSTEVTYLTDGHAPLLDCLVANGKPRVDPDHARAIHIDLARTLDYVGFVMGHPTGMRPVERMLDNGTMSIDLAPGAYIDMMLRIQCPPDDGAEVPYEQIMLLIFAIADAGIPIGLITMDTYQSKMMVERLNNNPTHRLRAEYLSVDVSNEPYFTLRTAAATGRFSTYYYEPFFDEVLALEIDPVRGKVDHTARSFKDVADAAAAVTYNCITRYQDLVRSPTRLSIEALG
jgi:hypothetical protein